MNISRDVENFIQDHVEEINNNDFSSIYIEIKENFNLSSIEVGMLSKIFLLSGINPLDYMNYVPSNFLRNVKDISNIGIPDRIEEIEEHAFFNSALKSIKLPPNLLIMGDFCFAYSGITKIEIPTKVSAIGSGILQKCYNLKEVIFRTKEIYRLPSHIFSDCVSLIDVKLPDNLTGIDHNCFGGCTSLTMIDLPSTISNIYDKAFGGCTNLKQINIPSLTNNYLAIGNNIFQDCKNLREINFGGTMDEWKKKIILNPPNKEIKQQCTIKCIDGNLKYDYDSSGWRQT